MIRHSNMCFSASCKLQSHLVQRASHDTILRLLSLGHGATTAKLKNSHKITVLSKLKELSAV